MSELNAFAPLLEAWSQFVNQQDTEVGRRICASDIRCVAYHEGVGGPVTEFSGIEAVTQWVCKPELGRYRLSINWDEVTQVPADARLPDCDHTLVAPFTIAIVKTEWSGWTNQARWTFAVRDAQVVGLVHEPQPLSDEQFDMDNLTKDPQP